MLVWLSSYPRSGNTFVRIVLNQVFGLQTYALNGDADDRVFSSRPGLQEVVGHRSSTAKGKALIEEAHASDDIYVIKTHEPPPTDDPAICIVRDGRSAIVSYFHYYNEVEKVPTTLDNVIVGNIYAGSWSDHFAAWNPLSRHRTLLVRYENVTRNPDNFVTLLRQFCAIEPARKFKQPFYEMHRIFPEFFRCGSDEPNIVEMQPWMPLFMDVHGNLMRELGYL